MEVGSIVSSVSLYAHSTQQTVSQSECTEKAFELSEADKLENFKKEIWDEINRMPWNKSINTSIQITDEAFKRMMNEPKFREEMMSTLRKDAMAGRYPITSTILTVDKNGYRGYSYNFGYGQEKFEAHAGDKDSFFVRRAKQKAYKNDLMDYYIQQHRERELQQDLRDKEYWQHKGLMEYWNKRQIAATSYEANILTADTMSQNKDMEFSES